MSTANPFVTLRQITGAYILSRCLHVVADLGIADALDETPRTAAELAAAVSAHPDTLRRVLTFLSSHGVFEADGDRFRHSLVSRLLRTDHPQSARAFVRSIGSQVNWAAYQELEYSLMNGLPAAPKVIPGGLWAYRAEHPEQAAIFNEAMAIKARAQIAAIMTAYDFSEFGMIGDIGGGLGHLLKAVLDSAPNAKGVLFDLPHVIEQVSESDRMRFQAGDFFKDTLPVCDAYLLMEVIHDWADEPAVAILKAIRQAAPTHAKLLLIESVIPDDPGPAWAKALDIHMLVLLGGLQRTRQAYTALLDQAGFSFQREIVASPDISIIEAVPI
jgi:hypothetical protein